MENEKSVSQRLDELIETIKEDKKKEFKLPWWKVRRQERSLSIKNKCIVQFVRENGSIEFFVLPIVDGAVKISDAYYDASAGYIMRYKKLPFLLLKEWDSRALLPLSKEIEYQKAIKEGTLTAGQKFLIRTIENESIKPKMTLNFKTIIIILAVLGAGYYLLNYLGYI